MCFCWVQVVFLSFALIGVGFREGVPIYFCLSLSGGVFLEVFGFARLEYWQMYAFR